MKSIQEVDFKPLIEGHSFYPSPERWEEQVLYFLMLDRFSDNNEQHFLDNQGDMVQEGETPPYNPKTDYENDTNPKRGAYGIRWNGGNLQGLRTKLGYLKRMGITTIWISPILKQVAFEKTYHGYGTQNFLATDPHFGSKEDFKSLVEEAHDMGMYVILDIIVNHSGDVFSYRKKKPRWRNFFPYRMKGFNDKNGAPTITPYKKDQHLKAWPDGTIWPQELQRPKTFTRRGRIMNWDKYPEYIEGDFYKLKNHYLGKKKGKAFLPSEALKVITEAYKYWIALADVDGFRLDTVKHMWPGAVKYFSDEIHSFAKSLGKENFIIIGEITGGKDLAMDIKKKGNLDAALGINSVPESLEKGVKGYQDLKTYFDLFDNDKKSAGENKKWFRNEVVTMFDDHDMVSQGEAYKGRFCADKGTAKLILNGIFTNVFTNGIPCIYYGTEQGFDGSGPHDRYIRESMFGGNFGAFRTKDRHFFREGDTLHPQISAMLRVRKEQAALKTGSQFYRMISEDGKNFFYPQPPKGKRYAGIMAWSRFYKGEEIVLAINSNTDQEKNIFVMIDNTLHQEGAIFECLFCSYHDNSNIQLPVVKHGSQLSLNIKIPAAGCAIFKRKAKTNIIQS